MTKTDMRNSFRLNVESIDEIFATADSFVAQRLLQRYETATDKTAFVAALIGKAIAADAMANPQHPLSEEPTL